MLIDFLRAFNENDYDLGQLMKRAVEEMKKIMEQSKSPLS